MKKRWSGVKPSRGRSATWAVSAFQAIQAIQASTAPPRSATSSPIVSRLLIFTSSITVYCAYCSTRHCVRASKAAASAGVHQSRRLPAASNCRPESSKPCVSSCPMVPHVLP